MLITQIKEGDFAAGIEKFREDGGSLNFTKGATICDFYSIETGAALNLEES